LRFREFSVAKNTAIGYVMRPESARGFFRGVGARIEYFAPDMEKSRYSPIVLVIVLVIVIEKPQEEDDYDYEHEHEHECGNDREHE